MNELKKRITDTMTAITTNSPSSTAVKVTKIEYNGHGDVVKGRVAVVRDTTHMGVPTISWEVRERGAHGRRTLYTLWLGKAVGQAVEHDPGVISARTVRGNYHGSTFQVIAESHEVEIEGLLDENVVIETEIGLRLV